MDEPLPLHRIADHPEYQSFPCDRTGHPAGFFLHLFFPVALLIVELTRLVPVGLLDKLWYYGGCLALEMIVLYYLVSSVWFWVHMNKT